MTHTYSHGCFKLIFRKCHPHTQPPTLRAASTSRNTPTHERFLSRLPAFSRFRTRVERYYNTRSFSSLLVFPRFGDFLSYFLFVFSYPFSPTSSVSFFYFFLCLSFHSISSLAFFLFVSSFSHSQNLSFSLLLPYSLKFYHQYISDILMK